jgi:peptidoglycan DL-endopeptidase CwlO
MYRSLPLLLLVFVAGLPGCRVMKYPAERFLPDPIPDPPEDVLAQVADDEARRQWAREQRDLLAGVVDLGRALVGKAEVVLDGTTWPSDCSGFVRGCFNQMGIVIASPADRGTSGTEIFYRAMARTSGLHTGELPEPGELVFFSNTYDRNANGELDDTFSHVGFVESVAEDGTVHFLHYVGGAVRIGRMNLLRPHDHVDSNSGTILNDFLRRRRAGDADDVRYLTSELWVAFGRVVPLPATETTD